jgi:hypothetical protein
MCSFSRAVLLLTDCSLQNKSIADAEPAPACGRGVTWALESGSAALPAPALLDILSTVSTFDC